MGAQVYQLVGGSSQLLWPGERGFFCIWRLRKALRRLLRRLRLAGPVLWCCSTTRCDQQRLWNQTHPNAPVSDSSLMLPFEACFLFGKMDKTVAPISRSAARMATVAVHAVTPAVCAHGSRGQYLLLTVTTNFLKRRKALKS